MFINGIEVVQSSLIQPVPKLQLSHDFNACSDQMKKSMNAWLLEKFGTYMPAYMMPKMNKLLVCPEHMALLRMTCDATSLTNYQKLVR